MKQMAVVLFSLFLASTFVYSEDISAPDGFLGLKWGSDIKEYSRLKNPSPEILNSNPLADFKDKFTNLVDKKEMRIGRRLLGKIGEVEVGITEYFFKRDRFCEAITSFTGERNYRILKDALILKYGKPTEEIGGGCRWKFAAAWIELEYGSKGSKRELRYVYIPIVLEGIREEKGDAEKTKDAL